jgi:DNA-binding response OmpR family regulator
MSEGRILVVDDESQIRRVMRAILIPQGFDVDDAKSGDEALDRLRSAKYDLVLLDIDMPGMTGFETCRAIRAVSEIPIFMLTGRSSEKYRVEAFDAGADDYITKPFSTPELLARIGVAFTRGSSFVAL